MALTRASSLDNQLLGNKKALSWLDPANMGSHEFTGPKPTAMSILLRIIASLSGDVKPNRRRSSVLLVRETYLFAECK
jgi:hypothetical protein